NYRKQCLERILIMRNWKEIYQKDDSDRDSRETANLKEKMMEISLKYEFEEMQKDMDEKMDVLINIQKNSKFPFRRGLKMQQDLRLIGKTDTDPQLPLRKMDGAGRAPLSLQKKMVALQQPKDPMDSLHRCDSCFEKRLLCTPQNSYDQGKVPYHAWASFSPLASGPAF
ncbi:hypothetical protein FD754_022701, partial [Muntiacus muntjak]